MGKKGKNRKKKKMMIDKRGEAQQQLSRRHPLIKFFFRKSEGKPEAAPDWLAGWRALI